MKNIVQKTAVPPSKIFIIKRLEEAHFDPIFHFHPDYQLFVVLKGKGTRLIGDNVKAFKEGDMVFTGPNLPHVWKDSETQSRIAGIVIYFGEDFLGNTVHTKDEMENIRHLFKKTAKGIEIHGKTNLLVKKMMLEMLQKDGIENVILLLKILHIIAHSTEVHPIVRVDYAPSEDHTGTDRVNKVFHYIMKNFKGKIRLEDIADQVNMTPTSFSRYFRSRVNKPLSDFIKEVRIDYARKLLKGDKMSIGQICSESGYLTLSNFNKQFKEVTGKTPLNYRTEYFKIIRDNK